ncbi:MAG: YihA family ribosome biogenesis GTP-binding protein [Ruminococcaceae bacterium]|nr:YihA family ribosome biogenesis GTP-binding protein [Oscillospiraceae bacterium]
MLNLNNINLDMTAGLPSQLIKNEKPQLALSGRSNVGKSSLINKLLNRKSLARVSGEPGKTITVNYYNVDNTMYLVDLPGYGYAKRSAEDIKKWSALVEGYFAENPSLKCVIQLIDLKVGITKDDAQMLDWLYETKTPFFIVATKYDKLSKTAAAQNLEKIKDNELVPDDVEVIPFSALSGYGRQEIWDYINGILG